MHPRKNITITWKSLSWKVLIAVLLTAALAAPVLAVYLGPDRVRTTYDTETFSYGVWAHANTGGTLCVPSPGRTDCIMCDWERDPYTASCAYDAGNYYYTLGTRTETVAHTTTYPPATISASLSGCTLVNGWCASPSSLVLTGSEPVSGYAIQAIEGTINGGGLGCSGASCTVPLSEGANAFTYWAFSDWGDTSEMGSTSQGQDTQPPTISGTVNGTTGDNGWYITNAVVSASAADAVSGASLTFSLDGVSPAAYTGALTLTDGVHTVVFNAVDGAGHTASASAAANVDTSLPSAGFTSPAAGWLNGTVTVSGTAGDATSGLAQVQLSLDGGSTWQSMGASAAWSTSWDTTSAGDGTHSLQVYSVDQAGNSLSPVNVTVNVDNTPPQLSLSAPGAFCAECGESIDLTYSVQDNGIGVASWQISVDGTPLISGAAGAGSTFSWDGSGLGTGDHSLVLTAVDGLGNSDSISVTVRLEAEPPVVPPVVIISTSRTATPTATAQVAGAVVGGSGPTPTARPTTNSGSVTFGSVETGGEAAPQAEGSPNLLWGAAALSLISATTAIVLNNRKKRKEEEIAELIACQIEAAKKNMAEEQKKIANYLSSLSSVQDTSLKMKQAGWSKKEIDKVIKTAQSKVPKKAVQGLSIDSVLDTAEDNLIKKAWLLKMGIAAATGVSVVSGLISGKEIYCNATAGTPITMMPLTLAGVLPVWGFFANKKKPGRGAFLGLLICCILLSACQGGSTSIPTITATLCTPTLDATATQTLTPTATEEVVALWAGPAENVVIEDLNTSFHIYFLQDFVREYGPSLGNQSLDYWENYWNGDFLDSQNNYGVNPLFLKLICLTETGCTLNPVPMGAELSQGVGLMQMTGNGYDFLFTNMSPEDTQRYSLYTSVIGNLYAYQPVYVITNNNIPVYDLLNTYSSPLYDPVSFPNLDWKIQVQNIAHVMDDGWCSSFEVAAGYCNNDGGPNLEEGPISIQEAALYIQLADHYNAELIPNWDNLPEETQGLILAAEYFNGYFGTENQISVIMSQHTSDPNYIPEWNELVAAFRLSDWNDCNNGSPDCVINYVNRFYCLANNIESPEDYVNCQGVGD